jgi:putative ABC transport system permease protein
MTAELLRDLRYGARTMAKAPGFTVVAALALALGIGATTAIFSVAYGILARPLPYPAADRVALVGMRFYPREGADFGTLSIRDYLEWKQRNHAFEEPALFSSRRMDVVGMGVPEQIAGSIVTAGFFTTMQVRPMLGRAFLPGEDQPTAAPMAVLGEALWRRRFAADPAVIGRPFLVNGVSTTIVGVMPASFQFPREEIEIWTNLQVRPPTRWGPWFYRGVARLKPGVTLEQAQAETNAIGRILMRENPYYQRLTLPVRSAREYLVGSVKTPLLVLIGAVGLVLLIAVVNVANLLVARATVRVHEMALRLSLGARRGRLIRQLLTENLLLAALGGAGGLLLADGGIRLLRAWNPGDLPMIAAVQLDGRALAFTLVTSILTGVLFGLAPAFQSARADLSSTLKEGGRGGATGRSHSRTRGILVIAEMALSLMLLAGAGLLLRSFVRLERVSGGFQAPAEHVLSMLISPSDRKYNDAAAGLAYYRRVLERARTFPGVESAALSDSLPPTRQADADTFVLQGQNLAPGETNPVVTHATVGADYFKTLGVPLLRGRYFNEHDIAGAAPVTIISESLAHQFFGGRDPIGTRLKQSGPGFGDNWMEIVGVVGDVKYLGVQREADSAYYEAFSQSYSPLTHLVVRTSRNADAVAEGLRRAIQAIDPGVTLAQVWTMREAMATSVSVPRFNAMLLALFAAIAVVLAAIGIYGVIAWSVARRTHEIGVRMALGAARADVWRMVIRQAATLALTGIALGLGGAFAITRLLATLLFGTSATDPLTFAIVAAGLLAVALLAAFIPARRATRISPMVALR